MGDTLLQAIKDGRITLDQAREQFRPPTMGERIGGAAKIAARSATSALLQGNAMIYELEGKALGAMGLDKVGATFGRMAETMGKGRMMESAMGSIGTPAPQTANDSGLGAAVFQDLPMAAGSMLGMMATPGPKGVKPGVMFRGALIGGAQGYWEARGAGADDDKAWASFAGNAALGLTEAGLPGLPKTAQMRLGAILARADKASGGGLSRAMWEGIKTGFSEATQEGLQQLGSNYLAQTLYDDDRKLIEGVLPSIRGSALAGLLTGGLAAGGGRTQATAPTPTPEPTQAPTKPVRVSMESLDTAAQAAVKDFGAGSGARVQPVEVGDHPVRDFVERRGARLVFVESEDGSPLTRPASYSKDGSTVVVDVNAGDALPALVDHEIGHHILENVEGARERIQAALGPELQAQALAEYHRDLVAAKVKESGRDLTPEELQAIEQETMPNPDEGIARLAEDFSPVIRLLRTNPDAFSKVQDVGFWRGLLNAVLDVGRSMIGKPSSKERAVAQLYRSVARRGTAAAVAPEEGIQIAKALGAFLDEAVGMQAAKGQVQATGPLETNAEASQEPSQASVTLPEPTGTPAIPPALDNPRGRELLSKPRAELEAELNTRLAAEDAALRESHPGKDEPWYQRVADLRRQARDPNNIEGDRAALQLKRAGIEPSGANVEEIADALRAKDVLAKTPKGRFGTESKAQAQNVGQGPQYAVQRPPTITEQPAEDRKILSRSYVVDALQPLKQLVEDAKSIVTDKNDPYLSIELQKGKTKARVEAEIDRYAKPLVKAIADSGLNVDDVELYLLARGATDRNALVKARTGQDNGSGMSNAQAAKIIAGAKDPAYKRIGQQFDALTKRTRDLWVEYGLESKETVESMERAQPTYAPFRSEPDAEARPRGAGRQIKGREFKAALGRGSMAENPLTYAMQDLESAIARGERNRALEPLYNLAKDIGDPKVAVVDVPPMKDALVDGVVRKVPDFQEAENEITFKVRGDLRRVRFTDAYAAIPRAIKGLDNEGRSAVIDMMAKATRFIAGMSTRWNPFFQPVNVVRDVQAAAFNTQDATFVNPKRIAWAMREIATNGAWAKRFKASGAPVAFMDLGIRTAERAKTLRDEIEALRGEQGMPRQLASKLAQLMEVMADVSESSTRLNAFRHAIEDLGMSDDRAAQFAKNITTNFERRGQASWLNAVYAFSNAGIQSTDRIYTALKKPGARKLAMAMVAGAAALEAMNRYAGGDDDDGIPYYDKVPQYVKNSNVVFMLPGTKGDYVTLPLPYVWGWFHTLGTSLATGAETGEYGKQAVNAAMSLAEQVSPLGQAGTPLELVAPTVAKPFVQIATGTTFTGSKMYPMNFGNRPDSELAWDSTNPTLVAVTRWLNKLSGGNERRAGAVDVSPITLEHLVRSFFGGLGGEVTRGATIAEKIATGEDVSFADVPLVRRFKNDVNLRDQRNIFRDYLGRIDDAVKDQKAGDEYDRKLFGMRGRADSWKKRVGSLEDQIRAADTPAQRNALRARLREVMTEAVKAIRETQR